MSRQTRDAIALASLERTQEQLTVELPRALTSSHRDFLLSVARAEPAWDLMPFAHLQELPALQWKLLNLRKLKTRDPDRFTAQHEELAKKLNAIVPRQRSRGIPQR